VGIKISEEHSPLIILARSSREMELESKVLYSRRPCNTELSVLKSVPQMLLLWRSYCAYGRFQKKWSSSQGLGIKKRTCVLLQRASSKHENMILKTPFISIFINI
jgi:hypothetical protein